MPSGKVKRYDGLVEVAGWGILPTGAALLIVKGEGGSFLRYVGFPVVFEVEESAVEVVSPLVGGV